MREACLTEALAVIAETGIEQLSLREVARRLGVSHQAPYKHFPSRDHILAEVVARCFDGFAAFLETADRSGAPPEALGALGLAYFAYARAHPLEYRLMFNTPLPDGAKHPAMMQRARYAFELLERSIARMTLQPLAPVSVPLDALFVWSTIHGLASILQSDTLEKLGLSPAERDGAIARCMARIGLALAPENSISAYHSPP
ncbi:TetR/AcrR family transcriptional regulator [Sphingomonas sp. 28-63-12]|uniref:TetR/AcrR family transcriptional regulator n=1 Tax=Sphingomonas sp. 28-63-12 TaxID=1970434 RepID=UPI0035A8426B